MFRPGKYARNGYLLTIVSDTGRTIPNGQPDIEFQNWLTSEGKSFEIWLVENPYTLEKCKLDTVSELDIAVKNYVYSHYEPHRQVTLTNLQIEAAQNNKTEALAYVKSCWDWIKSAFAVYYVKAAEINACATIEEVQAVTWDLSSLDATDPVVTIQHTLELLA